MIAMFLWDSTNLERDGNFDEGVVTVSSSSIYLHTDQSLGFRALEWRVRLVLRRG
jgi:hypothetical protein